MLALLAILAAIGATLFFVFTTWLGTALSGIPAGLGYVMALALLLAAGVAGAITTQRGHPSALWILGGGAVVGLIAAPYVLSGALLGFATLLAAARYALARISRR